MSVPSQITDLSTTAASNSPLGTESIGTSLDDYLRAIQGIMRAESENKAWERWNDTPTRTGATTFTVLGDLTARYVVDRRVKCTDSSTLYGTITGSSFGSGVTTVTLLMDSGSLTNSLTEVQLGVDIKGYKRTSYKLGNFTRDLTASSEDVPYTGIGFKPDLIIFVGAISGVKNASIGLDDGTNHLSINQAPTTTSWFAQGGLSLVFFATDSDYQQAIVKTLDADGFTLTWTKTVSPTGTGTGYYLALKF